MKLHRIIAAVIVAMFLAILMPTGAHAFCGYWQQCEQPYYQTCPGPVQCNQYGCFCYAPYPWGPQYTRYYAWSRPGLNDVGPYGRPAWAIPYGQGPAWGNISNQRPAWQGHR